MIASLTLPASVQTIPGALAFWAKATPDALALRAIDGQEATFRELHDTVRAVAGRLIALAVGTEDRVALVLGHGFDAAVVLLGTVTAAIAAPFNPAATVTELRRDLERLCPRLLVTGCSAGSAMAVAGELGILAVTVEELLTSERLRNGDDASGNAGDACVAPTGVVARSMLPPLGPDSIAAILHTSGTTGLPKRVPRPHRTFLAGARAARQCSTLTTDDVLLLTSSLHTNSGLVNLCAALANGGCCVVTPGCDPVAFPAWLERHQPTWMVSTAAELNLILEAAALEGRERVAPAGSRLRLVRAGAMAMTPGTAERAEASLGALILDGMGMTEASYITGCGPDAADRRPGSCGPPLCSEIRVLDERDEDLPSGGVGEVVIRGETLFPGYLEDPEANAAAILPGGWFRTGDVGSVDEGGYLYLIGRLNELINRGGEKIAPVEVDRALLTHPAVAEAAAFAVPDRRYGEDVVAAVVLRPGATATARELRRWLLERLTPYKAPRRIWFIDQLPRTATGKVQRGELSRRWAAEGP